MIQSPVNTGGKYRILQYLLPLFPENVSTFVDLFCGGCNVGLNVKAERYVFNDISRELTGFYRVLQRKDIETVLAEIYDIIGKYDLSLSDRNGYEIYDCQISKDLSGYNKLRYQKMRNDFNAVTDRNDSYYILFYVMLVYAFNHRIHFNRAGKFNVPSGRMDFNMKMKNRLLDFAGAVRKQNITFSCADFEDYDCSGLSKYDLVYLDPPCLISCGVYNRQTAWSARQEKQLLQFVEELDARKIRFAYSAVLKNQTSENRILSEWLETHDYCVYYLEASSDHSTKSTEILIANY